jgi:hypothetical protein
MALRYIRQGAGGANNGTDWTNAFTSIPASLTRGDTYYVADTSSSFGTYTFDDIESTTLVTTIKKATIADHGTSTGWLDSYGDGVAEFGTLFFMTDYWVFDGAVGGGPGTPASPAWMTGHGFKIAGGSIQINPSFNPVHTWEDGFGSHIQLKHVEVDGTGTTGTEASIGYAFASDLLISYCWTHDSAECFMNTLNTSAVIVEYTCVGPFCLDCSVSIHGEVISWKFDCGNLTFRYNLVRDAGANGSGGVTGGLLLLNSPGAVAHVHGNVFYRAPGETWSAGGDGLIGPWTNFVDDNISNLLVYNNSFVNCSYICAGLVGTTPNDGLEWKNNYFYNSVTGLPNGAWDHDYNQYQDSGSESEPNGTTGTGDPFVDFEALDFSLVGNTTAGVDLGATFNSDMYGNARTTWTRGAVEFDGEPPAGVTIATTNLNIGTLTIG